MKAGYWKNYTFFARLYFDSMIIAQNVYNEIREYQVCP